MSNITRKYFFVLFAFIGLASLSSCRFGKVKGSGHQITENRKVESFDRIEVSGAYEVKLKQDSTLSISVTADDNLMKHIRTNVSGGKLHIFSKRSLSSVKPMVLVIGVKSLNEVKVSGAVDIEGLGRINTTNFSLNISGASKVKLDLSAADVSTEARGATEIYMSGQAASHKVKLTGAGKLFAYDFVVGDYKINTAGATHCEINVLKNLAVDSRGASEVSYKGNPSNVSNHKSGASSINKAN
ncbi:DUF2807 domain-containing protein [Mucilaginibacter sp. Bleaf8]|uniref:head GIN domain-containing protein n=1 Tax=Mucilaginibacter sp. Bleaf8 TaxID=2834430 RepID=UPI001BCF24E7|nr:head GIN domain-containing protein [Mucilaginibacter sp. Bleaf8]MBS7565282.1 DUF2807 domain-containing protein [Mucilaginibacter sp. Bleaf8]